jgi:MoxR-like ATPase
MTTTTTLDADSGAPGTGTTAQCLAAIAAELAGQFYERDAVVRALIAAMLAGQHSLLLGPPGTAKSELARELTGRIDGLGTGRSC